VLYGTAMIQHAGQHLGERWELEAEEPQESPERAASGETV